MNKEWTEDKVEKLRVLFLKKWESLNEDDRAFGNYLSEHNISVMGLRDVSRAWNMDVGGVCIENPTFEGKNEVAQYLERESSVLSNLSNSSTRKIVCEETWYLVPEEFADKALVLGLP